jgi:hypothetical protein
MTTDPFNNWVSLARVDFQNDVQVSGKLPAALTTYLRTEAFPMSAPPSLRAAPDYGGLKIFVYQRQYVCVALFFNAGRTDPFKRAIPSASVLVFDRNLLQGGLRNLPAVHDFLADVSSGTETFEEQLTVLRSLHAEASVTRSEEHFEAFFKRQGVDYGLAATALALLVTHGRLVICCPERSRGFAFFSTLFALAPVELLESATWCSYADSAAVRHEEVVVQLCQLEQPGQSKWLGKVKNLLGGEEQSAEARIDVSNGVALGVNTKAHRYRLAEKVVRELRANALKLPFDFEQRFKLLTGILGSSASGVPPNLGHLLPADAAAADTLAKLNLFIQNA